MVAQALSTDYFEFSFKDIKNPELTTDFRY